MFTEEWQVARRVLVVQSRPRVAGAIRAALADAGVEAIVRSDGHGITSTVERWDPDVVLVDLTLPALDGWCVLAEVGGLASPPLIVTRVGDAGDVSRALALGADAWVDDDVHLVAAAGRLVPSIAA